MLKVSLLVIFLTVTFMVSGAFAVEDELALESRMIVKRFGSELKGELLASLEEGGPLNAISVCAQKAPAIAESISKGERWEISRTGLKVRNPENAPDLWEQKTLEAFEKRRAQGEDVDKMEHYETLTVEGKQVFRYMKAIKVGKPCLTCHGKELPLDLKDKLVKLYPEDQSTGFSPGEIIGAFSISLPK